MNGWTASVGREGEKEIWFSGADNQGFSPSLQRARKPFLIPNIIVGTLVASFVGGIYAYAISAVKQDDFVSVCMSICSCPCREVGIWGRGSRWDGADKGDRGDMP